MDLISFKEFVKLEEAKKPKNDKPNNDTDDETPIPDEPKTKPSIEVFGND